MNLDETRLKEIQQFKLFYQARLKEENTELGVTLIQGKLKELNTEETEILERCKVKT